MTTYVLVPGAWLGAWSFDRITPALRAAGHTAVPLTLTGQGDREHLFTPAVNAATHTQDVVAALEMADLTDVVLVASSYGGTPATGAAHRVPERIRRLVYLDAWVPADGLSIWDQLRGFIGSDAGRDGMVAAAAAGGLGDRIPFSSDAQLREQFGDHGLTPEDLAWMRRRASPFPLAVHADGLPLGNPAAEALPKLYVRSTATQTPSPVHPGDAGWDYAELATGHWPHISAPVETAGLLLSLA